MTPSEKRIEALIAWAHETLGRLRHEPAKVVADQVGDQVLRVHSQLGVEVADDAGANREVIITAFSEATLFPLVRRIAGSLSGVPGWRFVALKPPRGFAFTLSVGQRRVAARSLEFAGMPDMDGGIKLILPSTMADATPLGAEAEEMAWLVVETGIGEELAGRLRHIEFSRPESSEDRHPIEELEAYVKAMTVH